MSTYLAVGAALILGVAVGLRYNAVRVRHLRRQRNAMRGEREAFAVELAFAQFRLDLADGRLADILALFPPQTWHPEMDPRGVLSSDEAQTWDAISEDLADEAQQWMKEQR